MNIHQSKRLIGHTILIGLRHYDYQENLTKQEQLFGTIRDVTNTGIVVDLDDGDTYTLPPYLWSIANAPRGEYKCEAAGRTIVNPDHLVSWSLWYPEPPGELPSWQANDTVARNKGGVDDWNFDYLFDDDHIAQMIRDKGQDYVGKSLIFGIRYYVKSGDEEQLVRQEQIHGEIIRVNRSDGVVIQNNLGEETMLPPDLDFLQPAQPGEYRLFTTGEVIVNPDYVCTWVRSHEK